MASKLLCCSLLVACAFLIHGSSGSAIPMWEYLSRGEKVNILADDDQNIISNRIKDKLATSASAPPPNVTKCFASNGDALPARRILLMGHIYKRFRVRQGQTLWCLNLNTLPFCDANAVLKRAQCDLGCI